MQLDPSGQWIESSLDFGNPVTPADEENMETLPPPGPVDLLELNQAGMIGYNGFSSRMVDLAGDAMVDLAQSMPVSDEPKEMNLAAPAGGDPVPTQVIVETKLEK